MKLKALKLRDATVLSNREMKAVWGRNGYGDPCNGYDEPINGGYLPEAEIVCGATRGRCWRCIGPNGRTFTGDPTDYC